MRNSFSGLVVDMRAPTFPGLCFRLRIREVRESHAHEGNIGGEWLVHGRVEEARMLVEGILLEMRMTEFRVWLINPHTSCLVFGLKDHDILGYLETVAKGEQTRDTGSDDDDILPTSFLH